MFLRQNTAQVIKVGPFLDSTDGVTPETGLTLTNTDFRLSKDGGNLASSSTGSATHDEVGLYDKTLSTTDTNTVGELVVHVNESGALPVQHRYWVLEEAVYDAYFGASAAGYVSSQVVASVTGAVGSVTGSVGSVAANGISATSIASNAITSSKIASGAISYVALDSGMKHILYSGPDGPGIFLNTTNGSPGTTFGLHGTAAAPVSTLADAITLAANLPGSPTIYLEDSSVTLGASVADLKFVGLCEVRNNTIDLNGQVISDAIFVNVTVTGTQAAGDPAQFEHCHLTNITDFNGSGKSCFLSGDLELDAGADIILDQCASFVAGGSTPSISFNNNTDLSMRHYSGGIHFYDGGSTNNCSLEGMGQAIIDATCSSFDVYLRGAWSETNNGTNCTFNNDASFSRTGGIPVSPVGEIQGTVGATSNTPVTCSSNLFTQGFTAKDIFKNRVIEWLPGSALYGAVSFVHAYDETNGDLRFSNTPNDVVPLAGDTFRIL